MRKVFLSIIFLLVFVFSVKNVLANSYYNYNGTNQGYNAQYPAYMQTPQQNLPQYPSQSPMGQQGANPINQQVIPQGNTDFNSMQYLPQQTQYWNNPNFKQKNNSQPKTLGELPAGTFVIDVTSVWNYRKNPVYSGNITAKYPVIWRKVANDHYSKDSSLLLSEVAIAKYPFCVPGKGIRDWGESDMRKFLNGLFYKHFSPALKSSILSTTIPYADLQGKPKSSTDNVFLLSIVEWGLSDRAYNGKAVEYDEMRGIFSPMEISAYENGSLYKYIELNFLSRTINRPMAVKAGYKSDVFLINSNGVLNTVQSDYDFYSVRPAINLKSSTLVKGPYVQKTINRVTQEKQDMVYYMFDFPGAASSNPQAASPQQRPSVNRFQPVDINSSPSKSTPQSQSNYWWQ